MDVIGVFLIIAAGFAVALAFASRCPSCGRFLALRFTSEERVVQKLGAPRRQREVRCKRCGHRFWRSISDDPPGAGN